MDGRVIEEYLVSLGWKIDTPGYATFKGTLKRVEREVESHTSGITKLFVGAAATIIGTYAAIAGATIALMEHVAESDLGFQLYALRMYMSVDAAKKLKMATDALGHSLEEIAWNPELMAQYRQLIKDQERMQGGLGNDFERQMRAIRDVTTEITRLKLTAQYLMQGVTVNLARAFGLINPDGTDGPALVKLREWINSLQENLPGISSEIATNLHEILLQVWHTIENIASTFLKFVGAIYGDKELQKGELSLKNFRTAFDDLNGSINRVLKSMQDFADFIAAHPDLIRALGYTAAGLAGFMVGGPYGAAAGLAAALGYHFHDTEAPTGAASSAAAAGITTKADVQRALIEAARHYGVPARVALAIAKQESGFNPNPPRGSLGEEGPMQLMPKTARHLGVNALNPSENIEGGVRYLAELFAQFRDWEKVIAAYNAGPGALSRGRIPSSVMDKYVTPVERSAMGTEIGTIIVQIGGGTNMGHDEVKAAVRDGVTDAVGKQQQRNIAQLAGSH